VGPILLTTGLVGLAIVLVDGLPLQKMLAASPSLHDQPQRVVAGYVPPIVSSPNALVHVSSDAVAVEPSVAPGGEGSSIAGPATAGVSFGVGDKLKIAFYERLNVEQDKWGRASSALSGIQLRPELSGEYTVQEDGTISIPLLGAIPVAGRSAPQVHAAMDEAFEHLLGRKGMVNAVLLERAPIYVLGPVKNPGSFKYVPGATVLHAIAMAGGLDRGTNDPWSKVEAVREVQKRGGAADTAVRLIARDAVLKAERDGTTPKIPPRLIDLVGAAEATHLVNQQKDRRKPIAQARKDRKRAVMSSIESAKQELLMYGHTTSLDKLVKTRQDRVDNTRALVDRKVVSKSMLSQVEGELSDAEQRRQDAINQYGIAKQRLASLQAEGFKVQADLENDLATEIDAVERQIADNERELSTSEGILKNLSPTSVAFTPSQETNGVGYQIVRRTATGPVKVAADGMTLLQPGDLVDITMEAGQATGLPASSAATLTPAAAPNKGSSKGSPVEPNADDQKIVHTIAQD
jgi:protein involved in polysaccharide export with SLBB domain